MVLAEVSFRMCFKVPLDPSPERHRRHLAGDLLSGRRRWHRPSNVAGGGAWTKLQAKSTTYSVTLVKQIIGAPPPPATGGAKSVRVDEESAGQRLDNFLLRQLKGVPKTHVYRIIRSGEVRVNKGRAAADTRVAAGDTVRLPPVRISESVAAKAGLPVPAREFPVLFEDDHLMAVDKPAGVAVHGGSGVSFGVIEQLRRARPAARMLELVHRLDRETSGILLVAKKRSALLALQDQFRQRETGKTYLALVAGDWPASKKVIDVPLHKYLQADGERRVKVVARDDPDGMRSITLVKVARQLKLPLPLAGEGRGEGSDPHDILHFPRGARAGESLHAVFEKIDFTAPQAWPAAIAHALRIRPPQASTADSAAWQAMVLRMLADVTATPLPAGHRLSELPPARRLVELEFSLPSVGLDAHALAATLRRHGYPVSGLAFGRLDGYLRGFIDLVYEHNDRYYVLDWKSNHLGGRAADYDSANLRRAMDEQGYHLQYLLYTVALHRYLQQRLRGYDYERHFGGVHYLFIRGVRPTWTQPDGSAAGVFFDRPKREAIEALDALLGQREGALA